MLASQLLNIPVHSHNAPKAKPGNFLLYKIGTQVCITCRVIRAFVRICSFTMKAKFQGNSASHSYQMPHACVIIRWLLRSGKICSDVWRCSNILAEVSSMELLMRY